MSTLSPAAQAVLEAAFPAYDDETLYVATGEQHAGKIAAAALRAAATQLRCDPNQSYQIGGITTSRRQLLAIATELEAAG